MRPTPVFLDTVMHEKRLSNSKLAVASRVSAPRIGQIRSGRYIPYDIELSRIADALGVDDPESLLVPLDAA